MEGLLYGGEWVKSLGVAGAWRETGVLSMAVGCGEGSRSLKAGREEGRVGEQHFGRVEDGSRLQGEVAGARVRGGLVGARVPVHGRRLWSGSWVSEGWGLVLCWREPAGGGGGCRSCREEG